MADGPVYLVCDRCGFFYGDVRLYPEQTVECPDCGSEAAWALPKLDKALEYQTQVRQKTTTCDCCGITFEVSDGVENPQHASDCAVHNEPAFPAGPCDCGATS